MSEKLKSVSHEQQKDIEKLANERERASAELEKRLELNAEKSTAENAEKARVEALELAKEKEKEVETPDKQREVAPVRPRKRDLDASFNKTMEHIRKDMSPASRTFSKVIHNPVVDKTSEAIGNTVARPNLILAGAIGTLTLCLAVYLIAKHYGYTLSGFEAIGTFIIGWTVGAVIEFARVGLSGGTRK